MRTAEECLDKAADMEMKAGLCAPCDTLEYLRLAQGWRDIASHAVEPAYERMNPALS